MRSWNKGISVFAVTLCACSTGAPNANQGQLVANSDAQHFGIGAYVVQNRRRDPVR